VTMHTFLLLHHHDWWLFLSADHFRPSHLFLLTFPLCLSISPIKLLYLSAPPLPPSLSCTHIVFFNSFSFPFLSQARGPCSSGNLGHGLPAPKQPDAQLTHLTSQRWPGRSVQRRRQRRRRKR
jgi:hypothetical protein